MASSPAYSFSLFSSVKQTSRAMWKKNSAKYCNSKRISPKRVKLGGKRRKKHHWDGQPRSFKSSNSISPPIPEVQQAPARSWTSLQQQG